MGPRFRGDDVESSLIHGKYCPPLQRYRHLGVRPRQHAISASRRSLASGRCADWRVRRRLSAEEARRIQKDYYRRYGTTMRGMMSEHGVHADDFLAYVHQIDHSPLQPNPAMGAAIARLPGRKLILTNGSTDHVDKVLERLGIGSHFEAVFDIIAAELEPKPAPQTYEKFLRLHQIKPTTAAMFEDLARNLIVPHQLGMTTVLVVPDGTRDVVREDWELEGRDAAHVDHVTDDLTGFLEGLSVVG